MKVVLDKLTNRMDLNDPYLIGKSHGAGFVVGLIFLALGFLLSAPLPGDGTLGFIAGAMFLTLLLAYRLHCETNESASMKILGVVPSFIFGVAWALVMVGLCAQAIHIFWIPLWASANLLFASFWYLGGMSRWHQLGLSAQTDPPPPCLGKILAKLSSPSVTRIRQEIENKRVAESDVKPITIPGKQINPTLADELLRAWTDEDLGTYGALLDEAFEFLKLTYEAMECLNENILRQLFDQARKEGELATQRAINMSIEQIAGEESTTRTRVPKTTTLR